MWRHNLFFYTVRYTDSSYCPFRKKIISIVPNGSTLQRGGMILTGFSEMRFVGPFSPVPTIVTHGMWRDNHHRGTVDCSSLPTKKKSTPTVNCLYRLEYVRGDYNPLHTSMFSLSILVGRYNIDRQAWGKESQTTFSLAPSKPMSAGKRNQFGH